MPNIKITVAGKIATNTTPGVVIVCGNSDYTVTFDLDAEWAAETARTARFVYHKDGLSLYQDVAFTGTTVAVPVLSGISYVLVGVYAGSLRTTTPAKVLCDRSILCGDPLEVLTPEEKAKLQAQIGDLSKLQTTNKSNLVAAINELLEGETGGLSSTAAALLVTILRAGVYSSDQSGNITALEAALAAGDTGDDNTGGDETPDAVTYTVTNKLTNVSSNNSAASVTKGARYAAILTAADGYTLDAVTVTMGGVDVTATAYAAGVVTIASVTGAVVITAAAVKAESAGGNLFDGSYVVGLVYADNGEINTAVTAATTTGFMDCAGLTNIYSLLSGPKSYYRVVAFYDADKTYISGFNNNAAPSETIEPISVPEGAAYVRVTFAFTYCSASTVRYVGASSNPDASEFVACTTLIE